MPPSIAAKSRKWCWTFNNPWGGAEVYDDEWVVEYMVVGDETCPTTGTPHHQGYVRFPNPVGLAYVRKLLPGAHWEACKGTEVENFNYCSKTGKILLEFGERESEAKDDKHQGKRNDINLVRSMIKNGAGMKEIIDAASSYQACKFGELALKYMEDDRDTPPIVFWFYGPTCLGKTRLAWDMCKALGVTPWVSMGDGQWFEGYDGHDAVILDDIRSGWCSFNVLLRLLDRYPFRVPVKGGSRQWVPTKIFITSPRAPHITFANCGEDLKQLGRRIQLIVSFHQDGSVKASKGFGPIGCRDLIGTEPTEAWESGELRASIQFGINSELRNLAHEVEGNTTGAPRSGAEVSASDQRPCLVRDTQDLRSDLGPTPPGLRPAGPSTRVRDDNVGSPPLTPVGSPPDDPEETLRYLLNLMD